MKQMQMTDGEIITAYRQAKDKKQQIEILADLNLVSKELMKKKLTELGLIDDAGPSARTAAHKPKPVTMDELLAMDLFNAGLDDISMADKLGVPEEKVVAWRRRMHLTRPRGARKKSPKTTARSKRPEPFTLKPPSPPVPPVPEPNPEALVPEADRICPSDCPGAPKPEPAPMTVERLAQIFAGAAEIYGAAPVLVSGLSIVGVTLDIRFDAGGDPLDAKAMRVLLETEARP